MAHHAVLHATISSHHHVHIPVSHHRVAITNRAQNDGGDHIRKAAGMCRNPKWKLTLYTTGVLCTCMVILMMLFVTDQPSLGCNNINFSPHTSLVFYISGFYCYKFSITKYLDNSPASQWNTSVYLLHQLPDLLTVYNFTLSENITLSPNEFYKWSFYLHTGSTYTINTCELDGGSNNAQICVIGGDRSFNDWTKTRSCNSPSNNVSVKECNNSAIHTYSKVIMEDDNYYFVYSTHSGMEASLQVDMSFSSLDYSINTNNVLDQCTLSDENQTCSVDIPRSFRGVAVLTTSAQHGPTSVSYTHLTLPTNREV